MANRIPYQVAEKELRIIHSAKFGELGVPGLTVECIIRRLSDNKVFDFDGSDLYQDIGSVNTLKGSVPELDAVNFPGIYQLDFSDGGATFDTKEEYFVYVLSRGGSIEFDAYSNFFPLEPYLRAVAEDFIDPDSYGEKVMEIHSSVAGAHQVNNTGPSSAVKILLTKYDGSSHKGNIVKKPDGSNNLAELNEFSAAGRGVLS